MSTSEAHPSSSATRWSVRPGDLQWKTWDGRTFVVYHVPSGQTTAIGRMGMEILWILQDRICTIPEIVSELSSRRGARGPVPILAAVPELVGHFDQLGIVSPAPPTSVEA